MKNVVLLIVLTGCVILCALFAIGNNDKGVVQEAKKVFLLAVGKPLIVDEPDMQKRAKEAVEKVATSLSKFNSGVIVTALADGIITREQYQKGTAVEKVTRDIFKGCIENMSAIAAEEDTVIIYTHSHGYKNGFENSQPLGGIVMDLPVKKSGHSGALLWNEYAELLLKIPAKNIVVLTMSCYSGGLVEYFNSPEVKKRWNDRRQKQGRNFVVISSQNKDLQSPPIEKDGEVINPFTYAVSKAFAGDADGFNLANGEPDKPSEKDGELTLGELIDFILYTTENTKSDSPRYRNIHKPQITGSFDRGDVLLEAVASVEELNSERVK